MLTLYRETGNVKVTQLHVYDSKRIIVVITSIAIGDL